MSVQYLCQNCSEVHPKWAGKCNSCGLWNTIIEEEIADTKGSKSSKTYQGAKISSVSVGSYKSNNKNLKRFKTGFSDIDQVLGGGLVEGSVVMIAGQPGIGKSTLLLQILEKDIKDALYITAEESVDQVHDRSVRLRANKDHIKLASSQSADDIAATIRQNSPEVCIVDSIQTVSVARLISAPGTVSQVTNSIHLLAAAAKGSGTTLIVVGHVTKEGSLAGPKVLEHLVDVVLYIEGERLEDLRILRTSKNRYGSTQDSALLSMTEDGLKPSETVSASLIEERTDSDGSVISAVMEGSQPLLVEVQALVTDSPFGYPKRTASGFDLNRLNILIAVLSRRTKLKISDKDIFVNVVGGVKVKDPGIDLAVCVAIASAASKHKLDSKVVVFGEVGLGGEIRRVPYIDKRIKEASNYSLTKIIGPGSSKTKHKPTANLRQALIENLKK